MARYFHPTHRAATEGIRAELLRPCRPRRRVVVRETVVLRHDVVQLARRMRERFPRECLSGRLLGAFTLAGGSRRQTRGDDQFHDAASRDDAAVREREARAADEPANLRAASFGDLADRMAHDGGDERVDVADSSSRPGHGEIPPRVPGSERLSLTPHRHVARIRVPATAHGRVQAHRLDVAALNIPKTWSRVGVAPGPTAEVTHHDGDAASTRQLVRHVVIARTRAHDGVAPTGGGHRRARVVRELPKVLEPRVETDVVDHTDRLPRLPLHTSVPLFDSLAQPRDTDVTARNVPRLEGYEQTGNDPRALRRDARHRSKTNFVVRPTRIVRSSFSQEHGGGECDVDVALEALAVEPEHERGEVGRHLRGHPRRL